MDNIKKVYGVKFPLPARMRERTKSNQYSQIQKELCDIRNKMDEATTCSIKLSHLLVEVQKALLNLGYTVIAVKDQYGVILSFEVEWYENEEEDE